MELLRYHKTDIYLLDQIFKGRFGEEGNILDAGTGRGRNLTWFLDNDFNVFACDQDPETENDLRERFPEANYEWKLAPLDKLPYADNSMDHVICSAVLHFAESEAHFLSMWKDLTRVCKPGGSLFIRTCVSNNIIDHSTPLGNGRYLLPDENERFLLTPELLEKLLRTTTLAEPFKWVNVSGLRCMGTVVLIVND